MAKVDGVGGQLQVGPHKLAHQLHLIGWPAANGNDPVGLLLAFLARPVSEASDLQLYLLPGRELPNLLRTDLEAVLVQEALADVESYVLMEAVVYGDHLLPGVAQHNVAKVAAVVRRCDWGQLQHGPPISPSTRRTSGGTFLLSLAHFLGMLLQVLRPLLLLNGQQRLADEMAINLKLDYLRLWLPLREAVCRRVVLGALQALRGRGHASCLWRRAIGQ
mmetsp:Transcript_11727/g.27641  ORF Transcript_11727/g.27641 Transcript_11727/m.27641 type:complete len:219 (+) Transcript_11727:609-1265(+)